MKLRPFSGRSRISRPLTTAPSALLDVSTSCTRPATVTDSATVPTDSCTSTRTAWFTFTGIWLCEKAANRGASTVRLYVPTGSAVTR